MRKCSGRYESDADLYREVGYCKRVDHPPTVVLDPSECCVNQHADFLLRQVDFEHLC